MSFLRLESISKKYGSINVLKKIDLEFNLGEVVAILGPSGCGKTTFMEVIGLQEIATGRIYINNKIVKKKKKRCYLANLFGYIYQNYELIDYYNVRDNLLLPCANGRKIKDDVLEKMLSSLNLKDKLESFPSCLSGGEQQRVAIGRTLLRNPKVILADEPTGSLDSKNAKEVMEIIRNNSEGRLTIIATHNEDLAYQYATRIIRIENGCVVEDKALSNPVTIDIAPINTLIKSISIRNAFKQTLRSYKKRKKGIIGVFLLFAICLFGIMATFGISEGAEIYKTCLLNGRLDSKFVYIEKIENNKRVKVDDDFINTFDNNVKYYSLLNFNYLVNNYFTTSFSQSKEFDFYYEISLINYDFLTNYQLSMMGLNSIPSKNKCIINSCFYQETKSNSEISFNYNSTILGKDIVIDKVLSVAGIIDEGSIYNYPTIYLDYSFVASLFSSSFIDYFFYEQDYAVIPHCFLIISDFEKAYNYLDNYSHMYSSYSPYDIKDSTYYTFTNSTTIIRSAFTNLIDSFESIMLCSLALILFCTLSLLILVMTYIFKDRTHEIALLKTFGISNDDILTIGFSEAGLISFAAFLTSFCLNLVANRVIYNYSADILNQSWKIDLLQISTRGLTTSFFVCVLSAFLSLSTALRKFKKESIGEVLKNE